MQEITMLYVMTMRWQPGLTREERDGILIRRAQWSYPDDVTVVGEYWTASEDMAIVVVFDADDFAPIMDIAFTWGDGFQVTTCPAISAEEGLKMGPSVLEQRRA
ncbi:DUF3303 family protein [Streptomyces sp. SS7]|uniref:DUF3303 domain-containing protein n=1 Tax=Streptomyces sp. SS7 TaxID=3108485 RepID=UPI0030EDBAD3